MYRNPENITSKGCYYLPGPISAEEWSRFQFYAHFIRHLDHGDEKLAPSVLSLLHRHAEGKPLFPNLLWLKWDLSTPELTWVITPILRELILTYDRPDEGRSAYVEYDDPEPTFSKVLLPTALRNLPALQDLHLPKLCCASFWLPLVQEPTGTFVVENLRVLKLQDSLGVLMDGGLSVISAIPFLKVLEIEHRPRLHLSDPGRAPIFDMTSIRTFGNLLVLRVEGSATEVAALVDAIVAPKLLYAQLVREDRENPLKVPCLPGLALTTLCGRNATTLFSLAVDLQAAYIFEPYWSSTDEITDDGERPFLSIMQAVLQLHELQKLDIYLYIPRTHGGARGLGALLQPAMLEAWPLLDSLTITVAAVTPDTFLAIARSCHYLEKLTVRCLCEDFARLLPPAASSAVAPQSTGKRKKHPLREVHLFDATAVSDPVDVARIAQFLHDLFPTLEPTRCWRDWRGIEEPEKDDWPVIMEKLVQLQGGEE